MRMSERVIAASNLEAVANLFGAFDGNVKAVELSLIHI